jgi:hypothetical protein
MIKTELIKSEDARVFSYFRNIDNVLCFISNDLPEVNNVWDEDGSSSVVSEIGASTSSYVWEKIIKPNIRSKRQLKCINI